MQYESSNVQSGINQIASLTFGRDAAQFRQLIELLTIVSIVLWLAVLVTVILRMGARRLLYKRHDSTVVEEEVEM